MSGDGAQEVWNSCASALREQVSDAVWHYCFQEVRPLEFDDVTLRLTVPRGIVRDRIQSRYESLVANALADIGRGEVVKLPAKKRDTWWNGTTRQWPFMAADLGC